MSGGRGLAPVMAQSPYCCPCAFSLRRSRNHYRPKCGPKQDQNFNSLFGRENSLFFAENSLFTLQKISLLVPPGDPILSRPGFISLHGPSESRTSGTTKP